MADRYSKERKMAAAKKATIAAVAAARTDGSTKKSKKDELPSFDELLSGIQRIGRISKVLGGKNYIMNVLIPGGGIIEAQCNILKGAHDRACKTKDHRGAPPYNVGDYYIVELTESYTKAGMATGELRYKIVRSEFSQLRKMIRAETKDPFRKAYQTLFGKLGLDGMDSGAGDADEGGFEFAEADSDDETSDDDVARKAAPPAPDDADVDIDAI